MDTENYFMWLKLMKKYPDLIIKLVIFIVSLLFIQILLG